MTIYWTLQAGVKIPIYLSLFQSHVLKEMSKTGLSTKEYYEDLTGAFGKSFNSFTVKVVTEDIKFSFIFLFQKFWDMIFLFEIQI